MSEQERFHTEVGAQQEREQGIGVYKAINAVQGALAKIGISKDRTNTQGQGYKFRGIDDVYNALSPLLAQHGLCIIPRILKRESVERQSKSGGALFYITVEAEFDFVASSDGSRHTARTFGEAMDSGDKATNKAMSAAYKYACFQAFAIPTEGDNDADSQTHVVATITPTTGAWARMTGDQQIHLERVAMDVIALLAKDKVADAIARIGEEPLDHDEKVALWTRFDSKQRAALKKPLPAAKPTFAMLEERMRAAKSPEERTAIAGESRHLPPDQGQELIDLALNFNREEQPA